MFCEKCGAEMKPTDAFCLKCGAPNPASAQPTPAAAPAPGYAPMPAAPAAPEEKKSKKTLFTIIGAAAVAALLLLIIVCRCTGPNAAARRYMRAYSNLRAKKIVKMLPKDYIEGVEDIRDCDRDDLIDDLEDEFDDFKDELEDEYGDNYRWTYEILKSKKIDGKRFRQLKHYYEEYYDMDGDRITAAKTVYVLNKYKGSKDLDYDVDGLTLIKYKGKWYVMD